MSIADLSSPRSLVFLDWAGSLLMLGSVWGWVYERISPAIEAALTASKRRRAVMERFVRIKYGYDFIKVESVQRTRSRYKNIGILPSSSLFGALLLQHQERKLHRRLVRFGLATEYDKQNWSEQMRNSRESAAILFAYWSQTIKLNVQLATATTIGALTRTLFEGRLAKLLFALGFLMWNMSKALSVWPLK